MKGRQKAEDKESATPEQPVTDGQEVVDKDLNDLLVAIQKASDERDQLREQLLRAMADFQNYRKRQEEQCRQLEQFATERLVRELLPVLDNFDRALASIDSAASVASIAEGLKLVDRQLRQV